MQRAQELAHLYNQQESLFDFDISATSKTLADLIKDFEPYPFINKFLIIHSVLL